MAIAPATAQLNLRQMAGEVISWNPDLDFEVAIRMIQNAYRSIVDKRNWCGLRVYGQVTVPDAYTTGTATVTANSPIVSGIGTAWDATMIGRQFRAGFTTPIYSIADLDPVGQVITLNLNWGGPSQTSTGYSIFQNIVSLGVKAKFILTMVNQRQGYPLQLRVPRQQVDAYDVWRSTTGWTYALVDNYPDALGNPQFELYPSPTTQQAFPFIAYNQPDDLVDENSYPATWIRSDVLVTSALANALRYRGKSGKYYDPTVAIQKYNEARFEIQNMEQVDNGFAQTDMKWDFGAANGGFGGVFNQSHAIAADGWDD